MSDFVADTFVAFGRLPSWGQVAVVALLGAAACLFALATMFRAMDPPHRGERRRKRAERVLRTPSGEFRQVAARHRAVDLDGHTREVRWEGRASARGEKLTPIPRLRLEQNWRDRWENSSYGGKFGGV